MRDQRRLATIELMVNPPIVSTRGLSKTYLAGDVYVYALRGVDLEVERGDFAGMGWVVNMSKGGVLVSSQHEISVAPVWN